MTSFQTAKRTDAPPLLPGWLVEPGLHPELPLLLEMLIRDDIVVLNHDGQSPPCTRMHRSQCTWRDTTGRQRAARGQVAYLVATPGRKETELKPCWTKRCDGGIGYSSLNPTLAIHNQMHFLQLARQFSSNDFKE